MKYKLIYKCRHCMNIYYKETEAMGNIWLDLLEYYKSHEDILIDLHKCITFVESDISGIADLVGFEMIPEENDRGENI